MLLKVAERCRSQHEDWHSQPCMTAAAGEDGMTFSQTTANTLGDARPEVDRMRRRRVLSATLQLPVWFL
jgi:hypothetical protein